VDIKTGPTEIVKVKLSDELAGFYKISGHGWAPRPDLPPPNTTAAALLGRICEVATSCDSAEVEVAVVGKLTAKCLDYLVELGHLEIAVDNRPLHRE